MSKMKSWEIIHEEDISPSKWFPLFRHEVRLANGKIVSDYFVSRLGNVAMIIPFLPDGRLVLVKQYKHGIREVTIEFPAGRIEPHQTAETAAIAELRQETGLESDSLKLIGEVVLAPTKDSCRVFGFVGRNCKFTTGQDFDETEDIQIVRATPREFEKWIVEGRIKGADSIALWMKYKLSGQLA